MPLARAKHHQRQRRHEHRPRLLRVHRQQYSSNRANAWPVHRSWLDQIPPASPNRTRMTRAQSFRLQSLHGCSTPRHPLASYTHSAGLSSRRYWDRRLTAPRIEPRNRQTYSMLLWQHETRLCNEYRRLIRL